MPAIFHQPVNRRSFLKFSALGAAVVASGCHGPGLGTARSGAGRFRVALISDTHVPGDRVNGYRGFNPWENLQRIVPQIEAARPEAVVHCGDAARLEGKPADYVEVKSLLAPLAARVPVYIAMGNHDDRANFLAAIPPPSGAEPIVKDRHIVVVEHPVVRLVVLDSLLTTNKTPGFLGLAQREWLQKFLSIRRDRPVVVFVHHTLGPADGELLDAERFFAVLKPHRHVKAVFYGHSHVWERKDRGHLRLVNLPAVGYNFDDKQPVGWVGAEFHPRGVDLTLHAFGGNRGEDGRGFQVAWS